MSPLYLLANNTPKRIAKISNKSAIIIINDNRTNFLAIELFSSFVKISKSFLIKLQSKIPFNPLYKNKYI